MTTWKRFLKTSLVAYQEPKPAKRAMGLCPFLTVLSGEGPTKKPNSGYLSRVTYCPEDPNPELGKEPVTWGIMEAT